MFSVRLKCIFGPGLKVEFLCHPCFYYFLKILIFLLFFLFFLQRSFLHFLFLELIRSSKIHISIKLQRRLRCRRRLRVGSGGSGGYFFILKRWNLLNHIFRFVLGEIKGFLLYLFFIILSNRLKPQYLFGMEIIKIWSWLYLIFAIGSFKFLGHLLLPVLFVFIVFL